MKRLERIFVGAAILALGLGFSLLAAAQAWPSKPVRLIIPYAAGGVFDSLFRPIAQHLTQSLGQPVIVENKPGASQHLQKLALESTARLLMAPGSSGLKRIDKLSPRALLCNNFKCIQYIECICLVQLNFVESSFGLGAAVPRSS